MCWEGIKKKGIRRVRLSIWEEEKCEYMRRMDIELDGEDWEIEKIILKEKELERRDRWERIENSRCNSCYKWIKGEGVSGYLKEGGRE